MNGRVSKRIRRAAQIFSARRSLDETVKRLKKEYKRLPYHQRKTPEIIGHSALLRRYHAAGWGQS
jgi:hypothetical protein